MRRLDRRYVALILLGICMILTIAGCQATPTAAPSSPAADTPVPATATRQAVAPTTTPQPSITQTSVPATLTPTGAIPTRPALPTIIAEWRFGDLPAAARGPSAIAELDGRLYVVSRADGGVAVLEDERMARFIPVCRAPAALAVDQETRQVFVGCEDEKAVMVIQDQKLRDTWKLDEPPASLAVADGRLFVGAGSKGRIDVLDTHSGAGLSTIAIEGVYGILALAADEPARRLVAAGYEHQYIVHLDEYRVLERAEYKGYNTLAVDPARKRWYVNEYDSDSNSQFLVAIDQQTNSVVGRVGLGGDPRQALVHPTTGRVYVANSFSNTVTVVEPERLTVIATVTVGKQPQGMCLDAAGGRLYVVNYYSDNVAVLDLLTNRLVGTLPLAHIPADLVADGKRDTLYAAAPASNSVFVLRAGEVIREVAAGLDPMSLSLDEASGALYVANYVGQTLSVIAPDDRKTQEMALSQRPEAVALDATRNRVYAGNDIVALDGPRLAGSFALQGVAIGSAPAPAQIAVDSAKNRLFVVAFNGIPGSNGGMVIYAVDAASGKQLAGQLGGVTTTAMTLDVEGRRLYSTAGRYGQYKLYVDDADALTRVSELTYRAPPVALAYVPATHHLFIAFGDSYAADAASTWALAIVDTRTLGQVGYWSLPEAPARLTADPSNNRVYLAVGATGRILVIQDVDLPAPPMPSATPTLTPWPTPTPSATPRPAPATPTRAAAVVVPTATPCSTGQLKAFAPYWTPAIQAAAGCPMSAEQAMDAAEQPFEKGRMLWRSDRQLIYVLQGDGRYWVRGDAWGQEQEPLCGTPPDGKLHPRRGFGFLWCGEPAARQALGWATEEERGYRAIMQATSNGLLWLNDRQDAILLMNDGTWLAVRPVR